MNIHEHPGYTFSRALLIYVVALLCLFYEMGMQICPGVMVPQLMADLYI